jgi:hypothetical protein
LTALLGGFAELFALTDANNPDVGGQASSLATFDGDPFPADDQLPDGEDVAARSRAGQHQSRGGRTRSAAFRRRRTACSSTAPASSAAARSAAATVTTFDSPTRSWPCARRCARSRRRWCSTRTTRPTPGCRPRSTAPARWRAGAAAVAHAAAHHAPQADFLAGTLVAAERLRRQPLRPRRNGAADGTPTAIESEASAIRGLLDAYLATSDTKYAMAAEKRLRRFDARFWMSDVRAFRTSPASTTTLTETPLAFGTLQGALRQYWKLVANQPGNEQLAAEMLERVQRVNKLVANGWDDANGDNKVQYPQECTGAGLQMGERTLTGELSHPEDGGDRDHDCVMEISVAKLPAALAGTVEFDRVDPTATK